MSDTLRNIPFSERSPLFQLFVSMLVTLTVGILLFTISIVAGTFIFDVKVDILDNTSAAVSRNEIAFLKYMLMSQEILVFIIPALILMSKLKPSGSKGFPEMKKPCMKDIILVVVLTFCIFPITGLSGQINSGLHLPDWLSGLEKWIIEKEDSADSLFKTLMTTDSFGAVTINLIMIAVLPAIGEEFIFRGVFQKIFCRLFKSGHLAIWITAFIFSFIHLQFFGFIPRFILGLLFGYLFYWSGTLWLPVISHFVNNAVPTIYAYIQGWEAYSRGSDIALWKQIIGIPVPFIACTLILIYFRNKSRNITESGKDKIQSAGV